MCGCESCEIVLRLALEALAELRVDGEMRRQHLDRDRALEPRVARPVDLAHPARADRRDDLVGAEPSAGTERHGCAASYHRVLRRPGEREPGPDRRPGTVSVVAVRLGHPEPLDGVSLEVDLDQDHRVNAHDPAVVPPEWGGAVVSGRADEGSETGLC